MKKIRRFMVKSSIGAKSMPVSSASGACRRDCILYFPLGLNCVLVKRDVVNPAEMHLVYDLDQNARRRVSIRDDQDAAIRADGAQAFDVGANGAHVHCSVVDPDLAIVENLDVDAFRVILLRLSNLVGRLTSSPTSLTNTAVMMKKISRLTTKSSIGARSMPVVLLICPRGSVVVCACSEAQFVRQQSRSRAWLVFGSNAPGTGP